MSNLPNWPGASHCYSRAYAMLARMGPTHSRPVKTGRRVTCTPSEEMRTLIDALDEGHEERVKGLLMQYDSRGL